jgi:hypothetical protein
MDPITQAIIAAAAGSAAKGLASDAYDALKALLKKTFGAEAPLSRAIAGVEEKPQSVGRQKVLAEEVAGAGADRVPEILRLAEELLAQFPPAERAYTQTATGDNNAQAADRSTAKVTVGIPPRAEK